MSRYVFGNAAQDGQGQGGWLLGHMMDAASGRESREVGLKWGVHPAGSPRRAWVQSLRATTLSVLVRGRFRILFPTADVVLAREGDYALWHPGVPHHWVAEEDSVILTVRWPSLENDSVEVPTPAERLTCEAEGRIEVIVP